MNLLKVLVLLPTALTLDCPAKPGPFQVQPPIYYRGKGKPTQSAFKKHVLSHQKATNKFIPPVCDGAVRVATFNINYHRRLHDNDENTEAIRDDLVKFNPFVVLFQKVAVQGPERVSFEKMLHELGYSSHVFKSASSTPVGNMVASKMPLGDLKALDLGNQKIVAGASFEVDGNKIAVLGTDLLWVLKIKASDPEDQQIKMITEYIKKEIAPKYDQYILAGDMSARWDSSEIQTLVKNGKLVESFAAIGAPVPTYTKFPGATSDFIFISEALSKKLIGSYVYQTTSSTNLPVIADIKLSNTAIKGLGANPQPEGEIVEGANWQTLIIAISVILVIGVAAAVAFFYYRQRSKV